MRKIAILLLFACLLCADNPILRPNEALVIDAKNNKINFTLEISKDGKIKKRFLSESEKKALSKYLDSARFGVDSAKSSDSALNSKKLDSAPLRHSHIKQWDKKKIIYEQSVHKMEILR